MDIDIVVSFTLPDCASTAAAVMKALFSLKEREAGGVEVLSIVVESLNPSYEMHLLSRWADHFFSPTRGNVMRMRYKTPK